MLENIVMALVVGFVVVIGTMVILQKFFDEKRKDNKEAMKIIKQIFDEMPKMFQSLAETQKKMEQEQQEVYRQNLTVVHDD